ncbi:hypothetical protein CJ030_MR8G025491 [Morella rubra]|uniref:Retrotransposon Copia-like N-terminal domain-containing protein n=1 Tax=Morella rubra TaxID=262757 RepID=A0A6A1UX84_9ROSI|nr:hypothetical protein CJ030_MR8G025491 [Morella rubra]
MAEGMVISIIRLSATNYMSWKSRMEDILYAKDMYDPLENEGKKPKGIDEAKWKKGKSSEASVVTDDSDFV